MGCCKMIKKLQMLCIFLFALVLVGCETKGATIKRLAHRTIDDTHPRATLILGSTDLVNNILLTNVRVGKVGLLSRASVDVQNLTDERYQLEYKMIWRDSQGFPVDESTVWHRFVLSPRKIKSFQSTGKVPEAYAIQFTVRFPDDLFIESDKQDREAKPFFD